MPSTSSSSFNDSQYPSTAHFDAEYTLLKGIPQNDDTARIWPEHASLMCGTQSDVTLITPDTLVSITARASSVVVRSMDWKWSTLLQCTTE